MGQFRSVHSDDPPARAGKAGIKSSDKNPGHISIQRIAGQSFPIRKAQRNGRKFHGSLTPSHLHFDVTIWRSCPTLSLFSLRAQNVKHNVIALGRRSGPEGLARVTVVEKY